MPENIKIVKRELTGEESLMLRKELKTLPITMQSVLKGLFFVGVPFFVLPFIPLFKLSDWTVRFYYWLSGFSFLLLLGVWIYFGERRKRKRIDEENEKMLSGMFIVVDAVVKEAITFDGETDLGPYWIGDLGNRQLLLLQSQTLLTSKKLDKSKINIVVNPAGNIIKLERYGNDIKVNKIKNEKTQKEYEDQILSKSTSGVFLFEGLLKTWADDFKNAKIQNLL